MTIGSLVGLIIGALIPLACAYVANELGWIHIEFAKRAHELNITKATPRVGCEISSRTEQVLPSGYNPHTRITVKIYNEGELAAQNIAGDWKYVPLHVPEKRVFLIRRDYLGHCENHTDSYLIEDSANWRRKSGAFDVEIEFFYTAVGEQVPHRYTAKYRYHAETERLIQLDYS
jgi:hypothetical protein